MSNLDLEEKEVIIKLINKAKEDIETSLELYIMANIFNSRDVSKEELLKNVCRLKHLVQLL